MADLVLQLTNVYAEPLGEQVDILFRHQTLSDMRRVTVVASQAVRIRELLGPPQGLYRLFIDPPSYLAVSQFVNLLSDSTRLAVVFPVDPKKVVSVDFPTYTALPQWLRQLLSRSTDVLGFAGLGGRRLYAAFDDIRRAGLLNIATKCQATLLPNGNAVNTYLNNLSTVAGDRIFAAVPPELPAEVIHAVTAGLFEPVSGGLHTPPAGFAPAGSFKTFDRYGNLQLTFFFDGASYIADIDIDDARGLEHIFQVVHNELTGRPTHPYDIHEILIQHQKLDPGYRFLFA
jgi:hypothetical protein